MRLERGTKVRVPKGTPIVYDTSPAPRRKVVGRTQIVEVHWMTFHPDSIYWAGAGGYWKGVELSADLEIVDAPGPDLKPWRRRTLTKDRPAKETLTTSQASPRI